MSAYLELEPHCVGLEMQYFTVIAGSNPRRRRSHYRYDPEAKAPISLVRRQDSQTRTPPRLGICSNRNRLLIFGMDHHDDHTLDPFHALFPSLCLESDCDFSSYHTLLPLE